MFKLVLIVGLRNKIVFNNEVNNSNRNQRSGLKHQ